MDEEETMADAPQAQSLFLPGTPSRANTQPLFLAGTPSAAGTPSRPGPGTPGTGLVARRALGMPVTTPRRKGPVFDSELVEVDL